MVDKVVKFLDFSKLHLVVFLSCSEHGLVITGGAVRAVSTASLLYKKFASRPRVPGYPGTRVRAAFATRYPFTTRVPGYVQHDVTHSVSQNLGCPSTRVPTTRVPGYWRFQQDPCTVYQDVPVPRLPGSPCTRVSGYLRAAVWPITIPGTYRVPGYPGTQARATLCDTQCHKTMYLG